MSSTHTKDSRVVRCLGDLSSVRAIDKDARTITYVAATETPVRTWRGLEVLRMSGMRPRRHIPFLAAHRHDDPTATIGSLTHEVVGNELHVKATYARTQLAEARRQWQVVDAALRGIWRMLSLAGPAAPLLRAA